MENYSINEVLEQAVQTEKLGYEFYTSMAKRFAENEELRKLFDTLALKERSHEKRFQDLKETVKDDKLTDWYEVSKYLRVIVESEFFIGKEKSLPSLEHVASVSDAVKFALGFEKETLLYFYALRDVVQEKNAVDEIITEEKSHIAWLGNFKNTLAR